MKKYQERICEECGEPFIPSGSRQRWCNNCRPIMNKKMQQYRDKQRYIDNPEREKQRHKEYREQHREQCRQNVLKWQKENPEKVKVKAQRYYLNHKDSERERHQQYVKAHPEKVKQWRDNGREKKRAYDKEYKKRPEVKARVNEMQRQRRKNDVRFKLTVWARDQIHRCLNGATKDKHSLDILGYTAQELKLHLESLWEPGMSWENYGTGEGCWNIDHIKPLSKFNFLNEDGSINYATIKEANSLDNLQPLDASENSRKKDKYDE